MSKVPTRGELKLALQQRGVISPPIDDSPIDVVSNNCIYLAVCDDIADKKYDLETFSRVYANYQNRTFNSIRILAQERFVGQSVQLAWQEGLMD